MINHHFSQESEKEQYDNFCSHEFIYKSGQVPPAARCGVVAHDLCHDPHDLINFYYIHYCTLNERLGLMIALSLIVVFFNFRYLAHVIDDFCSEGLAKVSDWLGFSQALAGVTLLAFANGAGDVITSIVASDSKEGVAYTIGSLFGAGLFCCCIVIAGSILLNSGEAIKFDSFIVYRDISVYIVSGLVVIVVGIKRILTWKTSVIFLGLYVLQVLFTVFEGWVRPEKKNKVLPEPSHSEGPFNQLKEIDIDTDTLNTEEKEKKQEENHHNLEALYEDHNAIGDHKGVLGYFWLVVDFPFDILSYFTLLPTEFEEFTWIRCMVYSATGTLFQFFVVLLFHGWTFKMFIAWLTVASLMLATFAYGYQTYENSLPPKNGFYDKLTTILSVISSVCWMYFLLEILIDVLNCLGMVLNLDASFLGFTILAVGNALPDALNTFALMKDGKGLMAISGAYNGQLFGLLVGFGLGNLKMCLKSPKGYQIFNMFVNEDGVHDPLLGITVVFTLIGTLMFTWVYAYRNKFMMGSTFAYSLIGIYLCFLALAFWYCFFGSHGGHTEVDVTKDMIEVGKRRILGVFNYLFAN